MTKKDEGKSGEYFVRLTGGPAVKPGLETLFIPGIPAEVPEIWKEDFERDPAYAKVTTDKELSPKECEKLHKSECKKAIERRDEWRANAGKAGTPKNAPIKPKGADEK